MKITVASSEEHIHICANVILVLRPHLVGTDLVKKIKEMIKDGYRLCFIEEENQAVAFAGYRFLHTLFDDRHIYIDDLCTLPEARGKGYGSFLLEYIFNEAKSKGLKKVTLDSGFLRADAHRLYLNKKFVVKSLHFEKTLETESVKI